MTVWLLDTKISKVTGPMVTGPGGANICKDCVTICEDMLSGGKSRNAGAQQKNAVSDFVRSLNVPKPAEIKAELDKFVIGQEATKKTLAVAVYNHYKRLQSQVNDQVMKMMNLLILTCLAFLAILIM